MTKATAALAAAGIDIAEVEPQLILKAIAADVSAPASARVSGCRKLIDHQTDRELREANNAALASSVNSRRSHRWTRTLLVPVSKRDHDIRCLRFVQLQTRPAVVIAPTRQIYNLGGHRCGPRRFLDRLNDVEPMRVEQERVFPEQIVELWNDGVVVGNGTASQLSQCLLELCGIKFHLGNPYVEEVPHPIPFVANDIRIKMFPLMTATHGYSVHCTRARPHLGFVPPTDDDVGPQPHRFVSAADNGLELGNALRQLELHGRDPMWVQPNTSVVRAIARGQWQAPLGSSRGRPPDHGAGCDPQGSTAPIIMNQSALGFTPGSTGA